MSYSLVQETKLPSLDKLTKDLACVNEYESFWAVSHEKKGYSGKEPINMSRPCTQSSATADTQQATKSRDMTLAAGVLQEQSTM